MILNLRCAICGEVKPSKQDTDELEEVDEEDVRPDIFICEDCDGSRD